MIIRKSILLCLKTSSPHLIFICVLLLACTVTAESVIAATVNLPEQDRPIQTRQMPSSNDQEQRLRRTPPRRAIEACDGKKEGDPCSVNTPNGLREGSCLSGSENIFACRPRQNASPTEARDPSSEQRPESKASSQPEAHNITESLKPTGPQHASPAVSPVKDSPVSPPQNVPSIKPESFSSPPPTPPLPLPDGIIDQLSRNISGFGSCLVAAIIAAGLTWYGFFKYSTLPLRRLRKVTQQLAGGDLSARVGEGLLHRKNEVVDLGRDVDRMAERIESLVGAHQRLIRDVSHELRSPLARLNVALELARQSAGPTHSAPFDRIERESERLNELIGQLLMLTKLESESGMLKRTDIDISDLIAEIAHDVDYEARNLNRRVEIVKNESVQFAGNREMLRQAFENVIRNAVRYTSDDTAVEIMCCRRVGKGRSLGHIEIRDHGPGVPESEIFNIFRPFYRVADARERQSGGTGVGLAISDRAVRLHGGSIRAMNATGDGLIVEIELPLDQG